MKAKAIIISGNGTNCETETAYACNLAGFEVVDIVHLSQLLSGEIRLDDYHFLNLAGGFLDGDDLGAAKVGVNRFLHAQLSNSQKGVNRSLHAQLNNSQEKIRDQILRFIDQGKLILGICNGFQLLVKFGLLPGFDNNYTLQKTTLTFNDSGKFEDRWVYLKVNSESPCLFTKDIKRLYLPVRHGEGKFITENMETLKRIKTHHLVLQYCQEDCTTPTMEYPYNPNGSEEAVAGICNQSGRIFGLMPHPEAYLHYTNHPRWTREVILEEEMGLRIFKNAYQYSKKTVIPKFL